MFKLGPGPRDVWLVGVFVGKIKRSWRHAKGVSVKNVHKGQYLNYRAVGEPHLPPPALLLLLLVLLFLLSCSRRHTLEFYSAGEK